MTEDELVGWHHRLDGHEFEQVPGVSDGQGSLACCSPWGRRVSAPEFEQTLRDVEGLGSLQTQLQDWEACSSWGRKELDKT